MFQTVRKTTCVLLFMVCTWMYGQESLISLEKLPVERCHQIEDLFRYFVQYENLGFVLFKGTKPACMITLPLTHKAPHLSSKIPNTLKRQRMLARAWWVFDQSKHFFPHPSFIFCHEYIALNQGVYVRLFVINRETALHTLQKHRATFARVLGDDFSPKTFLDRVEKRRKLLCQLNHSERLLGILLGFGEEASKAYEELTREEESLQLGRVSSRIAGCKITPVSFRGDLSSLETRTLVQQYQRETLEIEAFLESENFFTKALEALCQSPVSSLKEGSSGSNG